MRLCLARYRERAVRSGAARRSNGPAHGGCWLCTGGASIWPRTTSRSGSRRPRWMCPAAVAFKAMSDNINPFPQTRMAIPCRPHNGHVEVALPPLRRMRDVERENSVPGVGRLVSQCLSGHARAARTVDHRRLQAPVLIAGNRTDPQARSSGLFLCPLRCRCSGCQRRATAPPWTMKRNGSPATWWSSSQSTGGLPARPARKGRKPGKAETWNGEIVGPSPVGPGWWNVRQYRPKRLVRGRVFAAPYGEIRPRKR
jgi:hypothetical protein